MFYKKETYVNLYYLAFYEINARYIFVCNFGERGAAESEGVDETTSDLKNISSNRHDFACQNNQTKFWEKRY